MTQVRAVYVRLAGGDVVPVNADSSMTAGDLKRELGFDTRDYLVLVNGVRVGDGERILNYVRSDSDEVEIVPITDVGSHFFNFLTGEKRLRQEDTLLRKFGFKKMGERRYVAPASACGRVFRMYVTLPETFPYSRPVITIDDRWFAGKHPCIADRGEEIEIHFHDEDWEPWMHAHHLAFNALRFLKGLDRSKPLLNFPPSVWGDAGWWIGNQVESCIRSVIELLKCIERR